MSRSKHAVELCALLVDETYGELTSRIFTILLRRGRLPVQTLSKHTRLTPRHVRHGLAVLIQQNLVYYHYDTDTSLTHYEANHDAAYGLVRSGKIMEIVEARYGAPAKEIVQNLFQLGHTKVWELIAAHEAVEKRLDGDGIRHPATNGFNGLKGHKKQVRSPGHLYAILIQLLQAGLIEPVHEHMFRSPTDTYNTIEREMLQSVYQGSTKGNKQKEELKATIREKMQQLRDEGQDWKPTAGKKRGLNGDLVDGLNGSGKRRRLSTGAVNGDHDYDDDRENLDPNLTLRINYEKCLVVLRNQRLVELANTRIGETTSQVYAELLRLMEDKIPRCRLDPTVDDIGDLDDGPAITTMEVAASLSKSIDVGNGIGKVSGESVDTRALEKSVKSKKRKSDEVDVDGEVSEDEVEEANGNGNASIAEFDQEESDGDKPFTEGAIAEPTKRPKVTFQERLPKPPKPEQFGDRQNRTAQIKNHLQLLANDACGFLMKGSNRGQSEWHVNYERVIGYLREAELDQMLLENFGRGGHRLARMFRKLGKLEEKQLPGLAFMKQKDIRTKLAEMQMAGMVDIQEVPRDTGRTTSRTMFLWYFDTDRVSAILLDSLYKCMSRCFQRRDIEKRRVHEILTAMQRQDTKGKAPEEFLEPEPLNRLRVFQRKEELLLTQIGRLDELIGIFRDY